MRIAEISGGNPFYALEPAHAMTGHPPGAEPALPASLAELMRIRIGQLSGDARQVLLNAACAAAPTVDLLARAAESAPRKAMAEASALQIGVGAVRLPLAGRHCLFWVTAKGAANYGRKSVSDNWTRQAGRSTGGRFEDRPTVGRPEPMAPPDQSGVRKLLSKSLLWLGVRAAGLGPQPDIAAYQGVRD